MVTREEILKIAKLSKLSVAEEELDGLTAAMGEIIAFADTINAAGAAAGEFDNINNLQNAFREDEVVPSYPRDEILKNVDGRGRRLLPVRQAAVRRRRYERQENKRHPRPAGQADHQGGFLRRADPSLSRRHRAGQWTTQRLCPRHGGHGPGDRPPGG